MSFEVILSSLPKNVKKEISLDAVKGLGEVDQQTVSLLLAIGLTMKGI